MPQVVHNIHEGGVKIGKPTHQGTLAHAKIGRNDLGSRLTMGRSSVNRDEFMSLLRPTPENILCVIP
jgi:hypothetical protein